MKKWPIALQAFSVRDDLQNDLEGTLKQLKEMGYDGIELAGTYGRTVAEVKKILDRVGLEMVSAHVMMDEFENDETLLDAYAAAGIKNIAIPGMDMPKTREQMDAVSNRIRSHAEKVAAKGITYMYHNHDWEFAKIDGKYILDCIFDEVSADILQTELDLCWVREGGEDPIEYLNKYAGRAPVVHLKDFTGHMGAMVYGVVDGKEVCLSPTEEGGDFDYRPVGYGKQDIPALVEASEKAGAQWLIVEQDEPSMGKSPMECARMSNNYLRSFL